MGDKDGKLGCFSILADEASFDVLFTAMSWERCTEASVLSS